MVPCVMVGVAALENSGAGFDFEPALSFMRAVAGLGGEKRVVTKRKESRRDMPARLERLSFAPSGLCRLGPLPRLAPSASSRARLWLQSFAASRLNDR